MPTKRSQRSHDHRLVRLVRETGDARIATDLGVPRTTAAGWLRRAAHDVTTASGTDDDVAVLRTRVVRLELRCRRLRAVLRLVFALLRALKADLSRARVEEAEKARLLRAVDRTRGVLGMRRVLGVLGLSPSRLASWRRAARGCELADAPSCPASSPQRLTPDEVSKVRELVTSPDLRHVPTGRLASRSAPGAAGFVEFKFRLKRHLRRSRPRSRAG